MIPDQSERELQEFARGDAYGHSLARQYVPAYEAIETEVPHLDRDTIADELFQTVMAEAEQTAIIASPFPQAFIDGVQAGYLSGWFEVH